MVQFILNQKEIKTAVKPGLTLLDFIRYHETLTGTKIGCREGDCGACTILCGEVTDGKLLYKSATSCLMPIANAHGKHIVTIEGLNMEKQNAIQEAFMEEGATQCGFCTPGFIVSLAGFCMSEKQPSVNKAIESMNGNICRCTGYKSIERAAASINAKMQQREDSDPLQFAVGNNMIPEYFIGIREKLLQMAANTNGVFETQGSAKFIGGGTDLYVQQHDTIADQPLDFLYDNKTLKGIVQNGKTCELGASVTVTDIAESPIFRDHFSSLDHFIKLVSSTQIRNMATVAGNFINASPIGDLTIFFLALDARIQLTEGEVSRVIPLRELYKGYKLLNKTHEEYISRIYVDLPRKTDLFNFEKVCKRTYLDIASVNTAICLRMEEDEIVSGSLSAGGVGPVPLYLPQSSEFPKGKRVSASFIKELIHIVQTEVSPISDARGTIEYKRLLLSQLIKAHFIRLFPGFPVQHILHSNDVI